MGKESELFLQRHTNNQQVYGKAFMIIHQQDTNQNHSETPSHSQSWFMFIFSAHGSQWSKLMGEWVGW